MKFLKYLTVLAAVVGLTAACTTDIEKTQIAPLDEVVVPVLHELPETAITINEETSSDKMKLTWDKADFKAPVSILYAVCAKLGDNSVELMTGITATEAELSNSTLSRLNNAVEKGGLAIEYEVPTVVNIYISAKVGANNVVYSESRELELTIFEIREPVKMYAHSEGGWSTCFIYGWGLTGCDFGDWPGIEITSNKETVNGKEYYYFEIPREAEGNTGNIIFNTGDGKQTQDITGVKMDESRYFTIAAEATDGKYIATEQVLPKKIKLYARSLAGWSKMYLYGWDVKGVSFEWPGEEITMTEFVDDLEWFVYELPMEAFETTGNIIFNNGDGQQTVDITGVTFSKNRFYEISAAPNADGKFTYTEIGGGNEPEPGPTPDTPDTPAEKEPNRWGIVGTPNEWSKDGALPDLYMDEVGDNVFVRRSLALTTTDEFKIRFNDEWKDDKNYGLETAGVVELNVGFAVITSGGSCNMKVPADGTYDIYFSLAEEKVWVMTEGQVPSDITLKAVKLYVDVTAPGWENCNIYVWDDSNVEYAGNWSGTALTLEDGKYVWTAPAEVVGMTINVIFNNGAGAQTADIKGVVLDKDHHFVVNADLSYTMDGESKEEEEKPIVLGEHTWGVAGDHNGWGDSAMTAEDGWVVAKDLALEAGKKFKIRADGAWAISYGHAEENQNAKVGQEYELAFNGKDMFVETSGTYDVYFTIVDNVAKMKFIAK